MPSRRDLANAIRFLTIDVVQRAKSGHPGTAMGMADIAEVLWNDFLRHNPANPKWLNRDRFVQSNGHGSMLIYSLLHLTGYGLTIQDLKDHRTLHSRTPGHPEYGVTAGVETTTGPLGQGIATAVGMALAERHLAAEFGDDVVDHHTYVICGDGDLMEGVSQEAIALAGHLKLSRMIVLYDDNEISIDGPISLSDSVDQVARFKSAGWNAVRVDGPIEANQGELLRDASVAGMGIALHSTWHIVEDLRAGRLEVVLPKYAPPATKIHAVMPRRRLVPPRVRVFGDFLARRFGDTPPWER